MCVIIYCMSVLCFFFFKQKTAYEMRISDWSSDVCSSDLWWYSRVVFRPNQAKTPSLVQAGRSTPRAFVYDSDERCNGRAGCDSVAPIKKSSLVEQSSRRSHHRDGPGAIFGLDVFCALDVFGAIVNLR